MGFANSIIGGAAALVRAAIKSPNFVTGSAGWSVNKDGSAEFDDVTVRGAVVVQASGGTFLYNGALGAGNPPVAWMSEAAADPFGNVLPAPATDLVSYLKSAGQLVWLHGGAVNFQLTADFGQGQIQSGQRGQLGFSSPQQTAGDNVGGFFLKSRLANGGANAALELFLVHLTDSSGTITVDDALHITTGGLAVTGGAVTDTLHATSTSALDGAVTVNAKETITAGGLAVTGGTTTDTLTATGQVTATGGTAGSPTRVATDSWQPITVFSNGWTATASENQRNMMLPAGSASKNLVKLQLDVTAGTIADGTQICNLPVAYRPATTQFLAAHTAGGTAITNGPGVHVLSSGNVQCFGLPTGTTQIHVNGDYALD